MTVAAMNQGLPTAKVSPSEALAVSTGCSKLWVWPCGCVEGKHLRLAHCSPLCKERRLPSLRAITMVGRVQHFGSWQLMEN